MAETVPDTTTENSKEIHQEVGLECAICLQTCIHPAQLPCSHTFCYLCIKGMASRGRLCPMCRQEIPNDFVQHPNLLNVENEDEEEDLGDNNYHWFYEGRNGWWMYDHRTCQDIEEAFQIHLEKFEILICGELYVIDLEKNVQYAKYKSWRKRNIKRDLAENTTYKGVAGIR